MLHICSLYYNLTVIHTEGTFCSCTRVSCAPSAHTRVSCAPSAHTRVSCAPSAHAHVCNVLPLQGITTVLEFPLSLTISVPAQIPNWAIVADLTSTLSRIKRSPLQVGLEWNQLEAPLMPSIIICPGHEGCITKACALIAAGSETMYIARCSHDA